MLNAWHIVHNHVFGQAHAAAEDVISNLTLIGMCLHPGAARSAKL
jgi:hypothetical protein